MCYTRIVLYFLSIPSNKEQDRLDSEVLQISDNYLLSGFKVNNGFLIKICCRLAQQYSKGKKVKGVTDAQKYSKEFESVSNRVVQYLLRGTNSKIVRTKLCKDGGYDIVALCYDGISEKKIYFECKMRSVNLNLRDIAANVIIAFNEGAVSFVAMTNLDYTPQLDEQFKSFYFKTTINIKILIGTELHRIITDSHFKVSSGLLKQLKSSKTHRNNEASVLRLNLYESDLYKQILYRDLSKKSNCDNYISKCMASELKSACTHLTEGRILLVKGLSGVGKSTFILSLLQSISNKQIHIDAMLYDTPELLLVEILLQVWGIPEQELLHELTDEYLEQISLYIGGKKNDSETSEIIRTLLRGPDVASYHSLQYNYLVCKYLIRLISLHKNNRDFDYIFYIINLEIAREEVRDLIVYLVKTLSKERISCVVEICTSEYVGQPMPMIEMLTHLHGVKCVDIPIATAEQGIQFLKSKESNLSQAVARVIVEKAGTRLFNLSLILDYFKRRNICFADIRQIVCELDMLTPNDIPNIIGKFFPFYLQKNRRLFCLLGLLNGKAPYKLLRDMKFDAFELDSLFCERILAMKQGNVIVVNELLRQKIVEFIYPQRPTMLNLANDILQRIDNDISFFWVIKIRLLHYIGQYQQVMGLVDRYIDCLRKSRQYSLIIECLDLAQESAASLSAVDKQAQYLIMQLEIIIIKKEIGTQKAHQSLETLSHLIKGYDMGSSQKLFEIAYTYFCGRREFKLGNISIAQPVFQVLHRYYQNCIEGNYPSEANDWLGKICSIYALFIKEIYGNNCALNVFENAFNVLPNSFELWRSYYSHKGCMSLYSDPKQANKYYCKIIDEFAKQNECDALPFHEYGDSAMSLLLAHHYIPALKQAHKGIELSESYGVMDEVGRILNIKGCILLCMGREGEAREQFEEATLLMERFGYHIYRWRSRLNLAQMDFNEKYNDARWLSFLLDTYTDFQSLLQEKIANLVQELGLNFFETREYHALLVFGKLFCKSNASMAVEIAKSFHLEHLTKTYLNHVNQLIDSSQFFSLKGNPYFICDKILMIG